MSEITQIKESLLKELMNIPSEKVYYTLRKLKVKPIFAETVETTKICLALHKRGLPITRYLVAWLKDFPIDSTSQLATLHILGDKKVLTIYRGSKTKISRWALSELFLNAYEGKQDEHRDS